jgi:5'-methylthioadenosine phosphorylase
MIGIIGGTGLEKLDIFKNPEILSLKTEFGNPSSEILTGEISGKKVAIISRHGKEHTITPTNVNNRANIMALKKLGCDTIIATTACGSLQEEMKPGDFVIANQFIDFTKHRINTFYDSFKPGEMQHCPLSDPFDEKLRKTIFDCGIKLNLPIHNNGTVITIEGPRFSTRAESHMFRAWGADVINMSTAPETALANEAGLKYAVIAIVTDYDCWKEGEESVSIDLVIENFYKNIKNVINLLSEVINEI